MKFLRRLFAFLPWSNYWLRCTECRTWLERDRRYILRAKCPNCGAEYALEVKKNQAVHRA